MLTENFKDADEFRQLSMVDQRAVIKFWKKRAQLQKSYLGYAFQKCMDLGYQIPIYGDLTKKADRFAVNIGFWFESNLPNGDNFGVQAQLMRRIHDLQDRDVLPPNLRHIVVPCDLLPIQNSFY